MALHFLHLDILKDEVILLVGARVYESDEVANHFHHEGVGAVALASELLLHPAYLLLSFRIVLDEVSIVYVHLFA